MIQGFLRMPQDTGGEILIPVDGRIQYIDEWPSDGKSVVRVVTTYRVFYLDMSLDEIQEMLAHILNPGVAILENWLRGTQ